MDRTQANFQMIKPAKCLKPNMSIKIISKIKKIRIKWVIIAIRALFHKFHQFIMTESRFFKTITRSLILIKIMPKEVNPKIQMPSVIKVIVYRTLKIA